MMLSKRELSQKIERYGVITSGWWITEGDTRLPGALRVSGRDGIMDGRSPMSRTRIERATTLATFDVQRSFHFDDNLGGASTDSIDAAQHGQETIFSQQKYIFSHSFVNSQSVGTLMEICNIQIIYV
ncbi:jg3973 [Pararge aegeria aegeria]|uniref:Jg3973 protein n=1 Tax=Pararge aegeria aegeria TaxID=348720 RepID=A0A8S4RWM2_9NEOP|nr:jg3973 [Pararge aegeria aegeria]